MTKRPLASGLNLELGCGIELSTKYRDRSIHLVGDFLNSGPTGEFREWIISRQTARHARNQRLVAKLRSLGFDITFTEFVSRGKKLQGHPHVEAIMRLCRLDPGGG
jgi:hypothetical protein